jgi:peroxiredoxin
MRIALVPFLLAATLAAQPVGWKDLTGQEAPPIEVKDWLNTGDVTPSHDLLRGKVWLLHFFTTDAEPCTQALEFLTPLHDKFFDVGFRIVAVSNEPIAHLRTEWVDKHKLKFWVGSDPLGLTHQKYAAADRVTFPHFYLIGADGKVIGSEFPEEAELRKLVEEAVLVLPPLHDKLARARTAWAGGAYGLAHKLAEALKKDADATVAVDATLLANRINAYAEFKKRLLDSDEDAEPDERFGALQRYTMQFDGLEQEKWANAQLNDLKKHDKIKGALAEWQKLESAIKAELAAEGKPDKLRAARQAYEGVSKKYQRSIVGRLAAGHARRMEKAEKPAK